MNPRRRLAAALALAAVAALGTACEPGEPNPEPLRLAWTELALPAPPAGERLAPRAVAVCAGRWYVTGAFARPDTATRPAAWTSADGQTWTAMTVAAQSYYGRRSVLYTAACRDGRLAAVGGKPGGAHGNPRVSSWQVRAAALSPPGPGMPGTGAAGPADQVLTEVAARFELYGGPTAVNVARLVAGPAGWLITGNRASGAAVWLSADAAEFRIVEGAPVLSSGAGRFTWASDAVGGRGGWIVVGGSIRAGRIDRDAAVWTSTDGLTWRGEDVPSTEQYDEMTLVAAHPDGPVAVGRNGTRFQAWRAGPGGWRLAGSFGSTDPDPAATGRRAAPTVAGLAVAGDMIVAATGDGATHRLWASADGGQSWRELASPAPLPAGAERGVAVAGITGTAGAADRLLLAVDDGAAGRLFVAEVPG